MENPLHCIQQQKYAGKAHASQGDMGASGRWGKQLSMEKPGQGRRQYCSRPRKHFDIGKDGGR